MQMSMPGGQQIPPPQPSPMMQGQQAYMMTSQQPYGLPPGGMNMGGMGVNMGGPPPQMYGAYAAPPGGMQQIPQPDMNMYGRQVSGQQSMPMNGMGPQGGMPPGSNMIYGNMMHMNMKK